MVHGGRVPSERVEFIVSFSLFNNRERFSFFQGQNPQKALIAERLSNFPPNDEN